MAELDSQAIPNPSDDGVTIGTLLQAVGDQVAAGTPKPSEPQYALYSVLVNQLAWTGSDALNTYSHEQWQALKEVASEIAIAIHTSTKDTDAEDLVSIDFHHLVRVIRRLRKAHGLTELGVMILLDNIIEGRLYKDLYYCNSPADFFRNCEHFIGYTSSRARDAQARGRGFKLHWQDIRCGFGSVPGISLEELCLRHLTKLSLYDEAVALYGREAALLLFTECTYRDFLKKIQKARVKAEEKLGGNKGQGSGKGNKASKTIDELKLTGVQLKLLHIVANGGSARLLVGSSQSQIDSAKTRLVEDRAERNLAIRAQIGHKLYDLKKPFEVNKELIELGNVHEIIDRIRAGVALVAPRRRTIAVLTYRLSSEPYFSNYWHHPRSEVRFTSFGAFAKSELGMGEEFRDYLRVGRNIAKYGSILDDLEDIDTDAMFYKLRYLDAAVETHMGDIALIRTRLANLSCREFAKFARDKAYDLSTTTALTKKYKEGFLEFVTQINSLSEKGFAVDVIECYAPEESTLLDKFLSEARQENIPQGESTVTTVDSDIVHRLSATGERVA
jgi:hypothetical protein